MHVAILGNRNSWYVAQLKRAARARDHRTTRVDFTRLTSGVCGGRQSLACGEIDVTGVDAVVVRTMPPGSLEQVVYRMDVLLQWEQAGVVVLNPPKAIECAVDKFLTTARLNAAGIPVPETIVCEDAETALAAFAQLGGDVVVKPLFGSEGRGILRVADPDLALRVFRTLERIDAVIYLQRYIEHEGFDIRAMVLDGEILGGMRRVSNGDFRTNVSRQSKPEMHSLSEDEQQLGLAAARAVGTQFAGVDLLYGRDGSCYVIEVNAVPGWQAFQRVTGCDVATRVIESLERRTA